MPKIPLMSHKSSSSRRSSGQKYKKTSTKKAKTKTKANAKAQKTRSSDRYLQAENHETSAVVVERTIGDLRNLGNQKFALSPFSQYFDDWLVNLREVLAGFESNPAISVDDQFVNERSQALADIQRGFAEARLREAKLEKAAKDLAENNHLLVEVDAEYAARNRELREKRDREVDRLTKNVHELEEELERIGQMKTSFFGFTKKAKQKKVAEATQKLNAAKKELELAIQNFAIEQETFHDDYMKKKQDIMAQVRNLEKEIESIETDTSSEVRQRTCETLINYINALLQRKPALIS